MSTWIDKEGRRHAAVMAGGKRLHRRLPAGSTARDSKLIEAKLQQALALAKAPRIPGDPPLTACMGLYLDHAQRNLRSGSTASHHAARIAPWAAKYTASQAREAAQHIIKDLQGHYAPGTINWSLSTLKKALRLAWEQNHTAIDYSAHVKLLPVHNAREIFLSVGQVQAIAAHCSIDAQAAIWAALLTGARRGELLKIKPEHIASEYITIPASHTKTLRSKTVPIVPALRPWLEHFPLAISADGLKSAWRRAREKAGMPDVNFHDLRHSCASILIELGVSLHEVSEILGHSTLQMTRRYAHLQLDRKRAALDKLSQAVQTATPAANDKKPAAPRMARRA
jgi:integrase